MAEKDDEFDDELDHSFGDEFNFDDDDDHENLFESEQEASLPNDEFNFGSENLNMDEDEEMLHKPSNPMEELLERLKQGDIKGLIIPAAVGAVILTFVIFFLTTFLGGGKTQKQADTGLDGTEEMPLQLNEPSKTDIKNNAASNLPENQTNLEQVVPPANVSKDQTPAPVTTKPSQTAYDQGFQEHVKDRILQLDADNKQLSDKINAISQQVMQNQDQLTSINQSISNMQTQVMKLNNALVNLLNAVQTTPPAQAEKNPMQENAAVLPEVPNYYVQAVIPGRAWLKDGSGKIITVGIGDEVPGLGTVHTIDAKTGTVTTSQGARIEYGIEQY